MSPVLPDYHADDDPPLLILGNERREVRKPAIGKVVVLFIVGLVILTIYCFFLPYRMPVEGHQELMSTDRTMVTEESP